MNIFVVHFCLLRFNSDFAQRYYTFFFVVVIPDMNSLSPSLLLFLSPASMVDVKSAPAAQVQSKASPLETAALALMALPECPLCLEKLDVSSKVLPCQHAFCVSCLQRHEAAHSQLLCPECCAPVPNRTAGELPTHSLPVRLPQGLQGSPRPSRDRQKVRYAVPVPRPGMMVTEGLQLQQEGQQREKPWQSEVSKRPRSNTLHIQHRRIM